MDEIIKMLDDWWDSQCVDFNELTDMFDEWCESTSCEYCKYGDLTHSNSFSNWVNDNFYILPKERSEKNDI